MAEKKKKRGRPKKTLKLHRSWTRAKILYALRDMLEQAKTDDSIITLKSLFKDRDYTYANLKTTINNRFKNDADISNHWAKIKEVLEDRIINLAARGELNQGFAKYLLNSVYGYMEQHQRQAKKIEHTINQNNRIEVISERKQELLDRLRPTALPEPVDVIDVTQEENREGEE